MNETLPPGDGSLPLSALCRVDAACWRFEAELKAGRRPDLADFLGATAGEEREALRRELIRLEAAYRRRGGEAPQPIAVSDETTAPHHATPPAAAPSRIGRYHVEGEVGRGGMGVVYQAHDPDLNRAVAVKVLRPELSADAALARRFLEEAQLSGQLQHPGLVPVHEMGRLDDGRLFFAMKLVKGRTLAELLDERPDPAHDLPRFLLIFEQVCQAVGYAHARGVLHRDLKPGNVMVGEFGEVQVMDWGLGKVLPPASRGSQPPEEPPAGGPSVVRTVRTAAGDRSRDGAVMGTARYMAPEQALGLVERVDKRSDVFGLGAILCVILTGRPPYDGQEHEVYLQAAQGDLSGAKERLSKCGADGELVRLALACLAPAAADRPANGEAAAEAAAAYRRSVQERLRAAELAQVEERAKALRARQRLRWGMALAASGLLTLTVVGVAGWLWQRQQAEADLKAAAATAEAHQRAAAAETDLDAAATAARAGEDALAREALERAEGRLAGGGPAELHERLRELRDSLAFAVELEEARMTAWEVTKESEYLNWSGANAAFAKAFTDRGLDVTGPGSVAALERIGRSPVKARIVAALDTWAVVRRQAKADGSEGLLEAAGRADDSGGVARRRLREAMLGKDTGRLTTLTDDPGVADWAAADAVLLADALWYTKERGTAEQVLRAARARNAGDFWLNASLGDLLGASTASREEGIGFWRAAVAARPRAAGAHNKLGLLLANQGKATEAEEELREAIRIKPDDPAAHYNLGNLLYKQGKLTEAEQEFRVALRIKPDYPAAHYNLGNLLKGQGKPTQAEEEYREALRILPDFAEGHCNLGHALRDQGRFREALAEFRRGHELGSRDPRWNYPSAAWVRDCQRLAELNALLPAVLAGAAAAADADAALGFARVCYYTKRHAAAARFSAEALAAGPSSPDAVYNAACSAALAGCGKGDDAPAAEAERVRLRAQALAWMRADLAFWERIADGGDSKAVGAVQRTLGHWREDAYLAGVRDADALAKLPEAEQVEWKKLWEDVTAVSKAAEPPK
jgi:serine/threonine-protein kinase